MTSYWLSHRGTAFPMTGKEQVVGRSQHCFIVLSSPRVSREHAAFALSAGILTVQDLGSRNGIVVNGQKVVGQQVLNNGDIVDIGGELLRVTRGEPKAVCATIESNAEEDGPSAFAQRNVLELAEELLLRAAEAGERASTARTIHSMVEALVRNTERTGVAMSRAEQARLAAVASVAARWVGDQSLDHWANEIENRLQNSL